MLPLSEVTWPRDGGGQTPGACSHGGHRGRRVGRTQTRAGWDGVFPRPLTLGAPCESAPAREPMRHKPRQAHRDPRPRPAVTVLHHLQRPTDGPVKSAPGWGPRKGTEGEWPTQGTPSFSRPLFPVPRVLMATHHTPPSHPPGVKLGDCQKGPHSLRRAAPPGPAGEQKPGWDPTLERAPPQRAQGGPRL